MLHHHRGTTGYALLFLLLFFAVSFLTLLLSGLCSAIGMQSANQVAGGVIFSAFWVCGFIVMQRFVSIENRRPTVSEGNVIGLKSVFYTFGTIICVGLTIASVVFLIKLFGGGGGGGSANEAAKAAPTAEQSQQFIGALVGIFGLMISLYLAPFLNLALISRFVAPRAKTV